MLINPEVEKTDLSLGLHLQVKLGKRRIDVPLLLQTSSFRCSGEKPSGRISARARAAFPFGVLPETLLTHSDSIAIMARQDWQSSRVVEIAGGQTGTEPMRMLLGQGLFGDSETQIAVAGNQAFLTTAVKSEGPQINVILGRAGKLNGLIKVI